MHIIYIFLIPGDRTHPLNVVALFKGTEKSLHTGYHAHNGYSSLINMEAQLQITHSLSLLNLKLVVRLME